MNKILEFKKGVWYLLKAFSCSLSENSSHRGGLSLFSPISPHSVFKVSTKASGFCLRQFVSQKPTALKFLNIKSAVFSVNGWRLIPPYVTIIESLSKRPIFEIIKKILTKRSKQIMFKRAVRSVLRHKPNYKMCRI